MADQKLAEQPYDETAPLPSHPSISHRRVRDPQALRALAHPVRVRLIEELIQYGSATATELAARTGETQANCSWHLRQLHRYGFVEEVEGVKGRQRPWRFVQQAISVDDHEPEEPGSARGLATDAVWSVFTEGAVEAQRVWRSIRHEESPVWWQAATEWSTWAWLTADELAAFSRELDEVAERHLVAHVDRIDPARRPPGCRAIRFLAWTTPGSARTETPGAETSHSPGTLS